MNGMNMKMNTRVGRPMGLGGAAVFVAAAIATVLGATSDAMAGRHTRIGEYGDHRPLRYHQGIEGWQTQTDRYYQPVQALPADRYADPVTADDFRADRRLYRPDGQMHRADRQWSSQQSSFGDRRADRNRRAPVQSRYRR